MNTGNVTQIGYELKIECLKNPLYCPSREYVKQLTSIIVDKYEVYIFPCTYEEKEKYRQLDCTPPQSSERHNVTETFITNKINERRNS